MRVKERLQHGFALTSALAAIAIMIWPDSSFGQIITASEPYESVDDAAATSALQEMFSGLSQLDRNFLRARQAVAFGDIEAAENFASMAEKAGDQKSAVGDSAELLRSLIEQQKKLASAEFQQKPE